MLNWLKNLLSGDRSPRVVASGDVREQIKVDADRVEARLNRLYGSGEYGLYAPSITQGRHLTEQRHDLRMLAERLKSQISSKRDRDEAIEEAVQERNGILKNERPISLAVTISEGFKND